MTSPGALRPIEIMYRHRRRPGTAPDRLVRETVDPCVEERSLLPVTMLRFFAQITIVLFVVGVSLAAPSARERTEKSAAKSTKAEQKAAGVKTAPGVGLSLEEYQASHPEYEFVRKFSSSDGSYQLWEAKDRDVKSLYIHIVNHTIEKISEDKKTPAERRQGVKPNKKLPSLSGR